MSLLEVICKELGVKVGERWLGNDGFEHIICEDGRIVWLDPGWGWKRLGTYEDILRGELKPAWEPVWEPKKNEGYYYPRIDFRQGYAYTTCENDSQDIYRCTNNMVFKTKEEAIEVANKMMKALMKALKGDK